MSLMLTPFERRKIAALQHANEELELDLDIMRDKVREGDDYWAAKRAEYADIWRFIIKALEAYDEPTN